MQFPECQLTHVNKNGQKKAKHNYICVGCYRQFIDCYQPHKGYSEEVKGECLKMSVNGMGFRAIERVKGVIMLCLRKSCRTYALTNQPKYEASAKITEFLWQVKFWPPQTIAKSP